MTLDPYAALGVPRDATPDAIRAGYRKEAKKAHPDGGGSPDRFAMVKLALDTLSDAERRAHYDRTGECEDKRPDQLESDAMNMVMTALDAAVGQSPNPELVDIVSRAASILRQSLAQMTERQRQCDAEAAKVRKLAKRFKPKKGKTDRLGPMLEAKARSLEDAGRSAVSSRPAMEMAVAVLEDHRFEVDTPAPQWGSPGASSLYTLLGGV